jgi:hypothetical protein
MNSGSMLKSIPLTSSSLREGQDLSRLITHASTFEWPVNERRHVYNGQRRKTETSTPMLEGRLKPLRAHVAVVFSIRSAVLALAVWAFLFLRAIRGRLRAHPNAIELSLQQLAHFIIQELRIFNQGRPLHAIFIGLFASLGDHINGLPGMYWLSCAISIANVFLLYAMLSTLESGQTATAAAAFALVVYPVDASQVFLTHAFGVQTSLSLFWVAAHCILSERRIGAALLTGAALLCCETPVTAFAAFPLLLPRGDLRHTLQHLGMIAALIGAVGGQSGGRRNTVGWLGYPLHWDSGKTIRGLRADRSGRSEPKARFANSGRFPARSATWSVLPDAHRQVVEPARMLGWR